MESIVDAGVTEGSTGANAFGDIVLCAAGELRDITCSGSNITKLVLPGGERQKLRGGEPTPIIVGTAVDLGGGIELTIEEV